MSRGSNQSVDTKFAACLICDAMGFLESGRVEKARRVLVHALVMLPDVADEKQRQAEQEFRRRSRPFQGAA